MTATSAMNPGAALQRSWAGVLRMAVVGFVFLVLVAGAFGFGRISASTSHGSPSIAPAPSAGVSSTGAINPAPEKCRVGRPC